MIGKTIPTTRSKKLMTDISNHNKRRTKKSLLENFLG